MINITRKISKFQTTGENINKKEKKIDITIKILKEKPRTKKEWRDESKRRGVKQATFYYHFNKLKSNNEIKQDIDKKVYHLIGRNDLADTDEIKLCIDQIKNPDEQIRNLGLDELIYLCTSQNVIHYGFLQRFFKSTFTGASYSAVHAKLLEAFRYILMYCMKNEQEDKAAELLDLNKEALLKLLESGLLPVQRTAISIMSLRPNRDILNYLYEIIESKNNAEYKYLSGVILESLRSHSHKNKIEIKRKLYEIAVNHQDNEDIKERAINLLSQLSTLNETILV